MVRKPKPYGSVSSKAVAGPKQQGKREVPIDGSFNDQPGSSQGQTGPGSASSANCEAKPDAEKKS
jgi:hypothetical protein